ncbi:hypothetical protein N9C22_05860 [Paracoccaceae bacterium]|nr:hypothetical protein [Paracoccaceae bacterium]
MKQFLLAASLLTLIGTQASAAFLTNRQQWNDANPVIKKGFVHGVFAEMIEIWLEDKSRIINLKAKVHRCAGDMALTDKALVEIVDNYYTDLENWSHPANVALRLGLAKVCKGYK